MSKSLARIYLDKDREVILKVFDRKCVVCGKLTNVIHEIKPISSGRKSLAIKNRVPLCRTHHSWAHDVGTNNSIPILQEKRAESLKHKWEIRCQRLLEKLKRKENTKIKIDVN